MILVMNVPAICKQSFGCVVHILRLIIMFNFLFERQRIEKIQYEIHMQKLRAEHARIVEEFERQKDAFYDKMGLIIDVECRIIEEPKQLENK